MHLKTLLIVPIFTVCELINRFNVKIGNYWKILIQKTAKNIQIKNSTLLWLITGDMWKVKLSQGVITQQKSRLTFFQIQNVKNIYKNKIIFDVTKSRFWISILILIYPFIWSSEKITRSLKDTKGIYKKSKSLSNL